VPRWDTSRLRAKGAILKTFGGRASGPEPLEALFLFAVNLFRCARARGRSVAWAAGALASVFAARAPHRISLRQACTHVLAPPLGQQRPRVLLIASAFAWV
jgi:hypothetical protein